MWEQLGELQFAQLCAAGLEPHHSLLDIGCGSLRGGIHFIRYLQPGNYTGIDRDRGLIKAGAEVELPAAGLDSSRCRLEVMDDFDFPSLGRKFDFALAQSVFTHLPLNSVLRCLINVRAVLEPSGALYATYLPNDRGVGYLGTIEHHPGGISTCMDSDPFHYPFDVLAWAADRADLTATDLGDWSHPRAQRMARFGIAAPGARPPG